MADVEAFGVPRVFLKNSNKVMKKLQISKAGQIPRCTSYFFNYQQHMKMAIFSKSIFFHTCLWWGQPPFVASMLKCVNFLSAPHFQSYQIATADINTWISSFKTKEAKKWKEWNRNSSQKVRKLVKASVEIEKSELRENEKIQMS